LATAALLAQFLFAQVTLVIAACLFAVGRTSRWRPQWIGLPAAAGLGWLITAGLRGPVASFGAGSRQLLRYLAVAAAHPARLLHPAEAFAGAGRWLPGELPLALLAGTAEAALVLWIGWWRSERNWRPGLIAALRRSAAEAELAAGHTVTRDGWALGLAASTGRLAGLSWAETEHGALLTGPDRRQLAQLGLAAVCAGIRRRKTVLILDLAAAAGRPGPAPGLAGQVTELARSLGVPVTEIGGRPPEGTAPAIGRAIRSRSVVLLSARHAETAPRLVDDLIGVLASLRDLELRGDCLAWISDGEAADPDGLARLLALAPATGTAVLLSTANAAQAAAVWPVVGVVVAAGPVSDNLALQLADRGPVEPHEGQEFATAASPRAPVATFGPKDEGADGGAGRMKLALPHILTVQRPGAFTVIIKTRAAVLRDCLMVPIALDRVAATVALDRAGQR
jgi:hypothetical protein